jgi:hypothetical protein
MTTVLRYWPIGCLIVAFGARTSAADTSQTSSSLPNRGDALLKGDRIILNADAPIFRALPTSDVPSPPISVCFPRRSQFEVWTAPAARTTTSTQNAAGEAPPVTSKTDGSKTTATTTSTGAGQSTTTTTETLATALLVRIGKGFGFSKTVNATKSCTSPPADFTQPVSGTEYEFAPGDLDKYSNQRYGFTYGGLVVPNKIIIVDRSFSQSTSLMPYVGYKGWSSWGTAAVVLAAGLGTASASTQQASGSTTSSSSTSTKATFSVGVGSIWTFGSIFQFGVLLGVDTAGSRTGYKYQGKPWIGVTLGAGT